MRIALLQQNAVVGDLAGNAARLADAVRRARDLGAELCLAPELALTGYPPRDLLLSASFVRDARSRLDGLAAELADCPPLLAGLPTVNESGTGRPLRNSAALVRDGRVEALFHKTLLPTYDVFDEDRYFEPGDGPRRLRAGRRERGRDHLRRPLERRRILDQPPL